MKFLVHLHIYYHNQVDYFIKKLSNIEGCEWDLYVTYVEENQQTFDKLKKFKPDTIFIQVENLGYDVWPFIQVIRKVNLDDYDYVLKLHTKNFAKKKSKVFGYKGYQWRNTLVNALIGSKRRFRENLIALQNNRFGMIFSETLYLNMNCTANEETFMLYYLKKRLHIKCDTNRFISGTMFIIKSDILNMIADSDIDEKDFNIYSRTHSTGTIAHALERLFPMIALEKNYQILTVKNSDYFKIKIRRLFYNVFNIHNSEDRLYKIFVFLGIRIYLRKKQKFPKEAIEYHEIFKSAPNTDFKNKRAAIFATYFNNGRISDDNIKYLEEIKKYTDYIIVVSDNPILPSEIEKTKNLADAVIFTRHGEYDFGSYKRGYLKLKDLGILDKIDNLLFFNDSVIYEGKSLQDLFKKSVSKDFYGAILSQERAIINNIKYEYKYLQSWFVMFSDKVFKTIWFNDFIKNIKLDKFIFHIYPNYELKMSKLISEKGFDMTSYYPLYKDYYKNPDVFFCHPQNDFENRLFIRKRFIK